jgi:HK97 gp10 family phage protein
MDIKIVLQGVDAFKRAIRLSDAGTRANTIAAIERGTQAVEAKAKAKAPRLSGEMAETIRDEYSKDRLVGYVKVGYGKLLRRSHASTAERKKRLKERRRRKGSKSGQGAYAPVIERGDKRRNRQPQPFMIPALNEERPTIIKELADAPIKAAQAGGLTT